jgi:hypothetical protein
VRELQEISMDKIEIIMTLVMIEKGEVAAGD